MSVAVLERDPALKRIAMETEVQMPRGTAREDCGDILSELGARSEDKWVDAFASAFFEEPMCWVGYADVLKGTLRDCVEEQITVTNAKLRSMFDMAATELACVGFLETRVIDADLPDTHDNLQYRYSPRYAEAAVQRVRKRRAARYAGEVAVGSDGNGEYDWRDEANCLGADENVMFPERGQSTREARELCRGCVVREDCLAYALANNIKNGIWGGLSERERRRLRRQRVQAARRVAT